MLDENATEQLLSLEQETRDLEDVLRRVNSVPADSEPVSQVAICRLRSDLVHYLRVAIALSDERTRFLKHGGNEAADILSALPPPSHGRRYPRCPDPGNDGAGQD